jgi:hypothetical protein
MMIDTVTASTQAEIETVDTSPLAPRMTVITQKEGKIATGTPMMLNLKVPLSFAELLSD